eukprot:1667766-Karenia_brevis.AAC.1
MYVPKRSWRASDTQVIPPTWQHSNGRKGYRKLNVAEANDLLAKNSTPTCRPHKGHHGPVKRKYEDGAEMQQAQALTDNMHQLYNGNASIFKNICKSTWYKMPKTTNTLQHYKLKDNRRLDCCMKCRQWDYQVAPAARASIKQWRAELAK